MNEPEEFSSVLRVYNKYPLSELIIHPRVRQDFYRHPVRHEAFEKALQESKNPVSFNGGLVTAQDVVACEEKYPQIKAIMLGQGLVADPFLAGKVKSGVKADKAVLKEFHDRLLQEYIVCFESGPNAMRRMKELWIYLIHSFADSDRHGKKIMKANNVEDFRLAVNAVFRDLPLLDDCKMGW